MSSSDTLLASGSHKHRRLRKDKETYIGEDGNVCDELHDGKPDTNVLSSLHYWAAILGHKLLGV